MLTSENVFVVSKRQCLLHLGAVHKEWGKAGTGEAKEGHTASYRHRLADSHPCHVVTARAGTSLKLCKERCLDFGHMEGRFLSI